MMPSELGEIQRSLGRVEAGVETLLHAHAAHAASLGEVRKRVSRLESWRWFVMGAAATVALVVDVVFRLLDGRSL